MAFRIAPFTCCAAAVSRDPSPPLATLHSHPHLRTACPAGALQQSSIHFRIALLGNSIQQKVTVFGLVSRTVLSWLTVCCHSRTYTARSSKGHITRKQPAPDLEAPLAERLCVSSPPRGQHDQRQALQRGLQLPATQLHTQTRAPPSSALPSPQPPCACMNVPC